MTAPLWTSATFLARSVQRLSAASCCSHIGTPAPLQTRIPFEQKTPSMAPTMAAQGLASCWNWPACLGTVCHRWGWTSPSSMPKTMVSLNGSPTGTPTTQTGVSGPSTGRESLTFQGTGRAMASCSTWSVPKAPSSTKRAPPWHWLPVWWTRSGTRPGAWATAIYSETASRPRPLTTTCL